MSGSIITLNPRLLRLKRVKECLVLEFLLRALCNMTISVLENTCDSVTGLILCGGQGRRMGGVDKGLIQVGGKSLVESAITLLKPQVGDIMISANRSLDTYASFGMQIVVDETPGFNGPLAGVFAALKECGTPWLLTVPCDAPNFGGDLAERLLGRVLLEKAEICCARDVSRLQPTFCLYNVRVRNSLENYLDRGERKIDLFFNDQKTAFETFDDDERFLNLNSGQDVVNYESSRSALYPDS